MVFTAGEQHKLSETAGESILVQSLWRTTCYYPGKLKTRYICTSAISALEELLLTYTQSSVYVCKDVHSSIGRNSRNLETQMRIPNRLEKYIAVYLRMEY